MSDLCNTDLQKSFCAKREIFFKRKNFFLQENYFSFGAELFTRFKCLNINLVDGGKNLYGFSDDSDSPDKQGRAETAQGPCGCPLPALWQHGALSEIRQGASRVQAMRLSAEFEAEYRDARRPLAFPLPAHSHPDACLHERELFRQGTSGTTWPQEPQSDTGDALSDRRTIASASYKDNLRYGIWQSS